ncbi:hypothetical protein FOL47_000139 [Perkinsus chesapeaki]|uniref:Uncharacterized protein n=1 Tax=Perkinsus chesapeaki TaxID=330153 RepID=A0A7J6N251_PERCH|nr:hypothetical protein FOL47_000139 [Perkinsus chesapeaki]
MRGGFDGKLVSIEDAELRLGRLKRENALLQRQLGILLAAKAVGDLHNHILERKQRPEPEEYINRMVNELSGAMLQQKRKGKIKSTTRDRSGEQHRNKDDSTEIEDNRNRSKDTSSKRDGHRGRSKDTSSKRDGHRSRKILLVREMAIEVGQKILLVREMAIEVGRKILLRDGHRSKHERREEELVEQERSSSSNEIPVRHADDRRVGVADLMGHLKDRMAKVKDNKDVRPLKNDTSKLEGRRRHRSKMTDRPKRHNKGRSKAAEREVAIVEEPQATFRESNEAASHSKLDCDLKSGTEQGTTIVDRLTDIASSLLPSSRYPAQPTAQDMPSNNVPDYGPQQTKEDALKVSSQKASNAVTAPPVARHIERHDLPFMPDLPPFKPGEFTIWKEEQARKAMIRARALALAGNKKGESSSDSD